MRFVPVIFSTLCVFAAALLVPLSATQATKQEAGKGSRKILPLTVEFNTPFSLEAHSSEHTDSIEFRAEDSMGPKDRQAVNDALPLIKRKASIENFDLYQGKWSYQQIVCPVFPEHILLLFARKNGNDDLSLFSAVLPRSNVRTVRILPILRRGYSPYSRAPLNPMTISTFNQIRAHEHPENKIDWLTTGLCYAALTGFHVALPQQAEGGWKESFPLEMAPLLQIKDGGIAVVRFEDVAAPQRPKEWDLTFDRSGRLIDVDVSPVPMPKVKLLP